MKLYRQNNILFTALLFLGMSFSLQAMQDSQCIDMLIGKRWPELIQCAEKRQLSPTHLEMIKRFATGAKLVSQAQAYDEQNSMQRGAANLQSNGLVSFSRVSLILASAITYPACAVLGGALGLGGGCIADGLFRFNPDIKLIVLIGSAAGGLLLSSVAHTFASFVVVLTVPRIEQHFHHVIFGSILGLGKTIESMDEEDIQEIDKLLAIIKQQE